MHSVRTAVSVSAVTLLVGILIAGCGSTGQSRRVTLAQIRSLESFESLLPVSTDSVVELYRRNDPAQFYEKYRRQLEDVVGHVDSLNSLLDSNCRIDTVAIDHSFENFGEAACSGHSIYLSTSYFILFHDPAVVRSVITHEFGHLLYERLTPPQQIEFEQLWRQLGNAALLYLFRDGEYSGNARFGGHPYDNPSELFASSFNLLTNRENELAIRLQFVETKHLALIETLKRKVVEFTRMK